VCHPQVISGDGRIIDTRKHVDGMVELGTGADCATCHGQPPLDGAHQAHVGAEHRLRGPLACAECHPMPTDVVTPGHIDDRVEVFTSGVGALARTDGATPVWDPSAGTCANVYCHGAGARLGMDAAPGLARMPAWAGVDDPARCGGCHGIPPHTPTHPQNVGLGDCASCHPTTVDHLGLIIVQDGLSTHINGVVDAQ
jgi:predicted CxxxxCH...CXXCH cytochrome family protein